MHNVMYLGMKPIGEMCFKYLATNNWNNITVKSIVSNPNADNCWWKSNYMYQFAKEHNIAFVSSEKRNNVEIEKAILENDINCIICNGYCWILPEHIIDLVEGNAFNLHLAPLPAYQGNFTYAHAILNGEAQYGVTLHYMTASVDKGDYIFMPMFDIEDKDTAFSLYTKSIQLGYEIFTKFVQLIESGEHIPRHRMEGEECFYSRRSVDSLRKICNPLEQIEIDRKSRAFYFPPFEGAFIETDSGKKYYIIPSWTVK